MKKIIVVAALTLMVISSIVYANQESKVVAKSDCPSCCPTTSCSDGACCK
ncbi:hypothetical protein K1X84_12920 [bacterium]|nr:hypothetical protein [bacterium]